ncbi:MAG TPA: hypothetical protein VKA15_23280 [Isosphaeraceae bacterium]|nr:hypothetical protein [Isosphaeraceae bacterium]
MDAGTTFLLSAGDIHLWIIISDPKLDPQNVLIVNLTSLAPRKEQSCVLRAGDHPWVRHDTCVNYGDSKVTTLDKLVAARDANALMIQSPVGPDILQRMRESAMNSSKMPLDHAEILISQGLVQP